MDTISCAHPLKKEYCKNNSVFLLTGRANHGIINNTRLREMTADRAPRGVVEGAAPARDGRQTVQEVFPHGSYLSAQKAPALQRARFP